MAEQNAAHVDQLENPGKHLNALHLNSEMVAPDVGLVSHFVADKQQRSTDLMGLSETVRLKLSMASKYKVITTMVTRPLDDPT